MQWLNYLLLALFTLALAYASWMLGQSSEPWTTMRGRWSLAGVGVFGVLTTWWAIATPPFGWFNFAVSLVLVFGAAYGGAFAGRFMRRAGSASGSKV